MSAWLCSADQINLIVNAHPDGGSEEAFNMLVEENLRSLRSRYPDRDFLKEWEQRAKTYKYEALPAAEIVAAVYATKSAQERTYYPALARPITNRLVAEQILESCASYDYQACETDDYERTPAAKFVREVRAASSLPGRGGSGYLWNFCRS